MARRMGDQEIDINNDVGQARADVSFCDPVSPVSGRRFFVFSTWLTGTIVTARTPRSDL